MEDSELASSLADPMVRYSDDGSLQWRAFKIRVFIAVALALVTFVSDLMKGDKNPITGEKQRVGMTVGQEVALGLESRNERAAQHEGLHHDPTAWADVQRGGNQLVSALEQRLDE